MNEDLISFPESPSSRSEGFHRVMSLTELELQAAAHQNPELQTLVQKMHSLKAEVATVTARLQDNQLLIQAKDNENCQLTDKLYALEMAVQDLSEVSRSRNLSCCSPACSVF